MGTESDQSSENRQHDSSPEEERQRTGLFRWDDPENLVPPWSVPPGLMVPGPRRSQAADSPEPPPPGQAADSPEPAPPGQAADSPEPPPTVQAADGQAAGGLAADDNSWPGVAPPAGWFLRAPQPPAAGPAPATSRPDASPQPHASPWRAASAVPSPRREPDGSWSSPLTPKPTPRALRATQALRGRAGGPGFQPSRSARPATHAAATPAAATPAAATPAAATPAADTPAAPRTRRHLPRGSCPTSYGARPVSSGSARPRRNRDTNIRPRSNRSSRTRHPHPTCRPRRGTPPPGTPGRSLPSRPRQAGPDPCGSRWARPYFLTPGSTRTTARTGTTGGAMTGHPSGNVRPAWCPRPGRARPAGDGRTTPSCSTTGCPPPGGPAPACSAAARQRSRYRLSCWWPWPSSPWRC